LNWPRPRAAANRFRRLFLQLSLTLPWMQSVPSCTSTWTTGSSPVVTKSGKRERFSVSSLPGSTRQSMLKSGLRTCCTILPLLSV